MLVWRMWPSLRRTRGALDFVQSGASGVLRVTGLLVYNMPTLMRDDMPSPYIHTCILSNSVCLLGLAAFQDYKVFHGLPGRKLTD